MKKINKYTKKLHNQIKEFYTINDDYIIGKIVYSNKANSYIPLWKHNSNDIRNITDKQELLNYSKGVINHNMHFILFNNKYFIIDVDHITNELRGLLQDILHFPTGKGMHIIIKNETLNDVGRWEITKDRGVKAGGEIRGLNRAVIYVKEELAGYEEYTEFELLELLHNNGYKFKIKEKQKKQKNFIKYSLKEEFKNKESNYWYKLFKHGVSINVMNGITPRKYFKNNGLDDENYKFLSLFINRLKEYNLLNLNEQKQAIKHLILEIYPVEQNQITNNANRLLALIGE